MKKLSIFFIPIILFSLNLELLYCQNGWFSQTSNSTSYLFNVQAIDENTVYVVGENGTILKTINGGANWNNISSGITAYLKGLYFFNQNTGWISGSAWALYYTTNGGTNWVQKTVGSGYQWLMSISFANTITGWISGDGGTILKTTNGGQNWFSQSSPINHHLESVYCIDPYNAWCSSDQGAIIRTTDGGVNWFTQFNSPGFFYDINFINSNYGWVGGNRFLLTTNSGSNWTEIFNVPYCTSVKYLDNNTGWITSTSGIYQSTNGGFNWTQQLNTSSYIQKSFFINSRTGWAVGYSGYNGVIYKTYTGGVTVSVPNSPVLITPINNSLNIPLSVSFNWYKLQYADSYHIQLSTDSSFNNLYFNDSLVTDTTRFVNGLNSNTNYYWRVRAKNIAGTGSFSNAWKLTTIPPVPSAPSLISPLNNSIGNQLYVNLVWNKPQFASVYRVLVSTDSLFSNIILNDSTLTDSIKYVSGLTPLTYYWWKVQAKNIAGWGNYSAAYVFRTLGTPSQINLIQPTNNSINQPVIMTFKWSKGIDPTLDKTISQRKDNPVKDNIELVNKYWFELVTDTMSSANLQRDTTLTDTTKNITGLTNLTNYWWRVKAKNEIGWGNFSVWYKFTTIVSAPTAPALVSPLNNSVGLPLNLNLQWNKPTYATNYRVQIATDSLFNNLIINDSTLTDSTKAVSGLQPLTYYYWKVNASNIGGTGNFSSVWRFRTIGSPYQITLLNPGNNSVNIPINVIFTWQKGTDQTFKINLIKTLQNSSNNLFGPEIVNKYWFELVTDTASFANLQRDTLLTDTTKNINGLTNLTNYWWRVKAKNEIGWGNFSVWYKFTTIISNPTVPLLFNPQNNSINIPTTVTLIWYKLQNATSYRLQVSRDSVFSQIVLNDSTLTDSTKAITGLDTLTKYYWRLNGKNIGGVSNWSSIWNFTTIPFPPSLPNLISPLNYSQVNTLTPVLNWDSIFTATNYRITISTDSNFASAVLDTAGVINSHYMVPAGKLLNNNSYFWKVKAINAGGASNWSTVWRFSVNVVGINSISTVLPIEYKLYNNYPNPFNPTTKIKFDLPKNGFTKLIVYDIIGREISVLINSKLNAGTYEYQWNVSNLSSGIYFYRLISDDFSEVKKMSLIK